jgi:hypothetical protein
MPASCLSNGHPYLAFFFAPYFVYSDTIVQRLKDNYNCGLWAGKLFCLVVILDTLLW